MANSACRPREQAAGAVRERLKVHVDVGIADFVIRGAITDDQKDNIGRRVVNEIAQPKPRGLRLQLLSEQLDPAAKRHALAGSNLRNLTPTGLWSGVTKRRFLRCTAILHLSPHIVARRTIAIVSTSLPGFPAFRQSPECIRSPIHRVAVY
jgi:hypothetical protein